MTARTKQTPTTRDDRALRVHRGMTVTSPAERDARVMAL